MYLLKSKIFPSFQFKNNNFSNNQSYNDFIKHHSNIIIINNLRKVLCLYFVYLLNIHYLISHYHLI